ncbi:MauE/DoxX family redox-associated membrane protein [Sphingobacterium faecium]|uniref:MauE/DoxX family redox-associated membrane protein n=1 Tax=Sphingobacterium faecium TaxID=34087 RepID=UPI00320A94F8
MNKGIRHIIAYSISIFLIIFWLFVGLEKAWNWQNFRISLQQQPLPAWSMDFLFWLMPLIEIMTGILLAAQNRKFSRLGHWSSILLLTAFTIFIGLGVAGVYEKRPCTCSSIFNTMSWEWHLVINIILLTISVTGLLLSRSEMISPGDSGRYSKSIQLFFLFIVLNTIGTVQSRTFWRETNAFVMPQKMTTFPSNMVDQFIVS